MMRPALLPLFLTGLAAAASSSSSSTSCTSVLTPSYSPPSVAPGWRAQLVASGLRKPRSIAFDSSGALLVVESGKGVSRLTFSDHGGTCLVAEGNELVVNLTSLNHGLGLSPDGKTLYASSVSSVFSWPYDSTSGSISTSDATTLISNMANNDLVTRTLLLSTSQPSTLLISRGSGDADLPATLSLSSGLSQIRAFDLSNLTSPGSSEPYDYDTSGTVLGWGLRNAVGLAEHPSGTLWAVENSADGVSRDGVDVHGNNPGDELNYLGFVNGTGGGGKNFGYPRCYAVWDRSEIPESEGLGVGAQFAVTENSTLSDETCAEEYQPPRITFPAHQAPLDLLFDKDGGVAYVTFHGSFDAPSPTGYRLASLAFDTTSGQPLASADSTTALSDIMTNPDTSVCPDACFRPVGLAWDSAGRLWMTSDTTGEIYVLLKETDDASGTATASGTIVGATSAPNGAAGVSEGVGRMLFWECVVGLGAVALGWWMV